MVVAYGLDLFFTRLTPSGNFDKLGDDFLYDMLMLTCVALPVALVVVRTVTNKKQLLKEWK